MSKPRIARITVVSIFFIAIFLLIRSIYIAAYTFAPDFSVMWGGARGLLMSRNPYTESGLFTGIGYPPNSLIFYIPLALLPYKVAQGVFVSLSALSIFGIVLLLFKIIKDSTRIREISLFLAFSLIVFSFPTRFTLGMGQNNLIALLLLLFSYYLYKGEQKVGAGIMLGLAISFKTIFIFFLLFFLLRRQWKILASSVLTIILVILSTMAIFGDYLYVYYIKHVVPPLLNLSGREIYYNQGLVGFIARLTSDLYVRRYLSLTGSFGLFYLLFKFRKTKNINLYFSMFIIALLLIDTLSWQHHFVWLIFPFVIIFEELFKRKLKMLYLVLATAYLLISWNIKNPSLFTGFPEDLILSNVFYGTVFLLILNLYLLRKKYPR